MNDAESLPRTLPAQIGSSDDAVAEVASSEGSAADRRNDDAEFAIGPFPAGTASYSEGDLVADFVAVEPSRDRVMVDVGAHHGYALERFADAGWNIHAFEPDTANRTRLRQRAKRSWQLTINDRAVAERDDDVVDFFTSPESTGVSTLQPFLDSHEASQQVRTISLATYLDEHDISHVDHLKIDTEGHDLFVLKSYPWHRDSPDTIECEFEDLKTSPLGYSTDELVEFLAAKGYEVLVSEWHPIVAYGIDHDFMGIWRHEPGRFTERSWGNLIAVRSTSELDRLVATARQRGVTIKQRPGTVQPYSRTSERGSDMADLDSQSSSSQLQRLLNFYRQPSGLLLALALVLLAAGFALPGLGRLVGLVGVALLAIFLPYRFARQEERAMRETRKAAARAEVALRQSTIATATAQTVAGGPARLSDDGDVSGPR